MVPSSIMSKALWLTPFELLWCFLEWPTCTKVHRCGLPCNAKSSVYVLYVKDTSCDMLTSRIILGLYSGAFCPISYKVVEWLPFFYVGAPGVAPHPRMLGPLALLPTPAPCVLAPGVAPHPRMLGPLARLPTLCMLVPLAWLPTPRMLGPLAWLPTPVCWDPWRGSPLNVCGPLAWFPHTLFWAPGVAPPPLCWGPWRGPQEHVSQFIIWGC